MTDETDVALDEATEEAVTEQEAETDDDQTEGEVESEEGEGEEPDPEEETKAKTRHQRRKEQMDRLRKEADDASQRLRDKNESLRKAQEAAQGSAQPKEDQFTSYDEYLVALGSWHAGKALDERSTKDMQRQIEQEQRAFEDLQRQTRAEVSQSWNDQVATAEKRYKDFKEVVYSVPISDAAGDLLAQMPNGADVAYQLGLDPENAHRIARMHPVEQALEIGRMEARLGRPRATKTTQAPDPVSPVRAKASPMKDPDKMSMAEYAAARKAGKI